jgi:anaerobic magnesium-protoporphyrin IX monomethyl ester cyclase
MASRHDVPYLLINAPLTDPTAPYHSISHLVGAACAAGHDGFTVLDANLEALEHMIEPRNVSYVLEKCRRLRARLEQTGAMSRGECLAYRCALEAIGLDQTTPRQAVEVLRDPVAFYDVRLYREAVRVLRRWMNVLSICGFAGQFDGFGVDAQNVLDFASVADLTDPALLDTFVGPFRPYFDEPFHDALTSRPYRLIGVSVNYTSQLPFAAWMCRRIRALCPSALLCIGGSEVTGAVKNLRDKQQIWKIFPDCDAIVVGEGESALIELLDAAAAGRPAPCGRPGILSRHDGRPIAGVEVRFEDLARLPAPRYDIWPWARYWSPEPVIRYAPSRGCYWSKCAFCDQGPGADLPALQSRVRPVAKALSDLEAAAEIGRTVCFAGDAVSASYLRRLCEALVGRDLGLRWSAELRLERAHPDFEMGPLARAAGCVAMSLGYGSGSQRMLDLMGRSVQIARLPELLAELAAADIGLQMMACIGFPGETEDEARETYRFLLRHAPLWTLCSVGDFELAPGAIMARQPARFGIRALDAYEGDDIVRALWWVGLEGPLACIGGRIARGGPGRTSRVRELARQLDAPVADRPFVGGIDSSHSLLYFAHNGRGLIPDDVEATVLDGGLAPTPQYASPLPAMAFSFDRAALRARHAAARARGRALHGWEIVEWLAEPHAPAVAAAAAEIASMETAGAILGVLHGGALMLVDEQLAALEKSAGDAYWAVKAILLQDAGAL